MEQNLFYIDDNFEIKKIEPASDIVRYRSLYERSMLNNDIDNAKRVLDRATVCVSPKEFIVLIDDVVDKNNKLFSKFIDLRNEFDGHKQLLYVYPQRQFIEPVIVKKTECVIKQDNFLDDIFGTDLSFLTEDEEEIDPLFRLFMGNLCPVFDNFPPAREITTDIFGEESDPDDRRIFDSFDNRRMIDEIIDGEQYTRDLRSLHGVELNKLNFAKQCNRFASGYPTYSTPNKKTDEEFEEALNWRLSQIAVRSDGDISPVQAVSERFQSFESHRTGRLARDRGSLSASNFKHEEATHTQFDRILFEQANLVGQDVKIFQLRTGDQVPKQYRPEEIMSWAKCTFNQAVKLVECYKWIDITFNMQKALNIACARRDVDHPAATILSDWKNVDNVADRFNKIAERGGIVNAKKYLRATRNELATRRGPDFDERYPEGRVSIIDIARAMKRLAKPRFEDAPISEDTDSYCNRFDKQTEDGEWYDSSEIRIDRFGAMHDISADTVYINPDGSPIISVEFGMDDRDAEAAPNEILDPIFTHKASDIDESGSVRDSETFGYWHMSVIPTDQALIGDPEGIRFYLKAMRVVARTKSLKKLTKLRLCVFAAEVKWNYTQKKKFWDAFRLRQAEIKFEHKLLRDKKSAFLGQQAEEWFAENTRLCELASLAPEFQNYEN